MRILKWISKYWVFFILTIIIIIPFYYVIPFILLSVALFKLDKVSKIKRIIDSSEKLQKIHLLFIIITMIGAILMAWGAIYLIPDAFDVWYSLMTFDFKTAFNQLSEPDLTFKEYISSTFELFFEIGLVLIILIIVVFLLVLLLRLYQVLFEKFINKQFISILKNYGYLIFEVKYSLELKNSDSNKSDLFCELCETKCINEKYTHRTYSEKEIDSLVEKDMLNTTRRIPSLDNNTTNKCKYKWTKKIISLVDSNDINRRTKIRKGDLLFLD